MVLHIIGAAQTTCTQRLLVTLAEKNVSDYEIQVPDFGKGEHKQPHMTAKQPFGVVPILQDGDFILAESRAICRYLATKYADQGTKLMPTNSDLKTTALFEKFASYEFANFEQFAGPLIGEVYFGPRYGLEPIPAVVDYMSKKLSAKLDIYERILSEQKYMAGNEFSVIDIFYMPNTQKLFESGYSHFINDRPHVKAWWERISSRESWKHVTELGA